jgi:hypothetical protein
VGTAPTGVLPYGFSLTPLQFISIDEILSFSIGGVLAEDNWANTKIARTKDAATQ